MADTINHPTLPPRDAPALLLIAGMVLLAASAASAVEPVEVPDNPSCQSLGFQNELKIDPPASGTYTIPGTSKTVTVTVDGANRFFDWSSTLGMDAVIVKGGDSANLYRYDPPAESFGDTGLHSPLCPSGQYCGLSHISFCYDWEVSVAKTAATSYTRTWQWAITKTAAPAVWNIFNGDRGTSLYAVSLLKTGYTDSNFAAAGAITVTNDTPYAASLTSVTDSVAGYTATVDCGVSFPYTLAAGATLGCTYTVALPNAEPRTNTATVTATGTVGGGLGTAAVAFGEPTTVVNGTVNVSDTNGGSWTFADSGSVNYTADFACPGDAGTHGNTATIVETGQSSSASVTVNCYALQVTKTALTSYDRNFPWTLDKSVNPSAWDLFNGDSATSQYTVTATRGAAVESNFAVAGIITVSNLNPARAATVNSVTDIVSGPISAPVTCGVTFPYLLGAGSQLQCSYGAPLPDKTNRTNTATATQQNFAYPLAGDPAPLGISSYSGDATVDFAGATVRETNASLTVADSYAGAGSPWTFNGSGSQSYSRTFNCGADEGSHDNTVTATLTGGGTLTDNASVHVDCHALSVNKSATAEYTRNFTWQIAKSADPAAWNLFDGDSGTTQYTVTLTKDEGADSAFGVSGSIWIANPSTERDALLTSVTDLVSPDIAAAVVCPSMTVPKGGTLTCTYTAALLDKSTRINTATAVQQNYAYTSAGIGAPSGTTSYSGNADVVFGDPTTEINGTVHVNDSNGTAWTFSASGSQTYTQPFTCAGVTWSGSTATFTHLNTAEILETDQTATASVDVQCYRLAVTKTAETAYRRTWAWTIDKSADQTSLTLSAGQQFQVNYSVAMGATSTDDQFAASGEIYVVNPNPSREATLASVTDAVTGGYAATVTCPTTTVTAGATLTCTYTVGLPDASGRVNTATATQQVFAFAHDLTPTPAGTKEYSGQTDVTFGEPAEVVDECADVNDVFQGTPADPPLGQVCIGDLPKVFTYAHWLGPYADCGQYTVENTASFTTNDFGTAGSDSWSVAVNVVDCAGGCTLTPGYWKTHSSYGPAPYDDTWSQIGENTVFFLSGQTYYQVLWTAPQGNVYYILAHAYIAAQLNQLNGASIPADVLEAFQEASALLNRYTPAEVATLKGKNGNDVRALFVYYAYILDQYNNGLAAGGPPHCSE